MNTSGDHYLTPENTPINEESTHNYTANLNELISETNISSSTEYFLSTLFQLSLYLFQKNKKKEYHEADDSFDSYLSQVNDEITTYDSIQKRTKQSEKRIRIENEEYAHELLECYQRVPFAFFQENFILDFGELSKNRAEIKKKQEEMNDELDLVEINLFSQIHNKFHEYFRVVANFDYLNQSLEVNIKKNKEARERIRKVKVDFVDKTWKLKKKIVHRQNIEKLIKIAKIIKSLKKLPSIIKEILESSLPYECLSLLKSTKESLLQANGLDCLVKTSQTILESESLVQIGLKKRYTDELYIYLEECQYVNLQEGWDRINTMNCMDMSGLDNSHLGISGILEESILDMQPSTSKNKRNEGKEFEIAMILLESYKFIDFGANLIRIKISNSLRVFNKKFDFELATCINKVLEEKMEKNSRDEHVEEHENMAKNESAENEEDCNISELVKKISVIFYVKHLFSYNEIMKDTMDRLIGYLHTLLSEYLDCQTKEQTKFIELFKEELSILPSITKVIIEKLIQLMSLKNISEISFNEFRQWISVLEYWKRYTDNLIEDNPLINYEGCPEIEEVINETFRKMVSILNIETITNELVLNYITLMHSNTISKELEPSFSDESWQAIEIPSEFVEVLNNVAHWHEIQVNANNSVTILNESNDIKNKSLSHDYTQSKNKFRVLKSNVLVEGVRYKISVSFMLFCEFLDEYVKMLRNLPQCRKFIYERILDLAEYYNSRTRELILEAKARQFEKMKSKNISAKHICLVHNCLSVLLKLINEISNQEVTEFLNITKANVEEHRQMLTNKLAHLLKSKVESTIANFLLNKDQKVSQANLSLLNIFVQMMGIIDEYLEFEDKKTIFREAIQIFMTRYFKELLLKGAENATENRILIEKMRFLRQYFPEEIEVMEKEVRSISMTC